MFCHSIVGKKLTSDTILQVQENGSDRCGDDDQEHGLLRVSSALK